MHLNLHLHLPLYLPSEMKNHASQRHSRDKCRIYGKKTIFLCICLCFFILPLYLHSEIEKSCFEEAFKR